MKCPHCGLEYDDMKTGYTFASVRAEMFKASDDPSQWRQKRRNSVLGFWHELKLGLWEYHIGQCGQTEESDPERQQDGQECYDY